MISSFLLLAMDQVNHTFEFVAERPVTSVTVAGTFNGWNANATPLKTADGRTWRVTIPVAPGRHEYKFVLDGRDWVIDPQVRSQDDGNGNINSLIFVFPKGYEVPADINDGTITLSAVRHEPKLPYLSVDNGTANVTLRTRRQDVEAVYLRVEGRPEVKLSWASRDDLYDYWVGSTPWTRAADLKYAFDIRDGATRETYRPADAPFVAPKNLMSLTPPKWVEQSVFYQIFPDRFENGNAKNDPENSLGWDAAPTYWSFHGGDLKGIADRSDHLVKLGVNAIYMNPIFDGPSNHGYETTDYALVAPRYGTNEELIDLTHSLRKRGIRTVLDGVFNHTSTDFKAFADLRSNGPASSFKDWYFVKSWPIRVDENPNYEAWAGFRSMPKVNLKHPAARDYMLQVVRDWQAKADIAGWRLDVANEVEMDFWRAFRPVVKKDDPDRWILGEVWTDASPWLGGDQWDSAMNYPFRDAVVQYVANGRTTSTEFWGSLMRVHFGYGPAVSRNMLNLLSSHDTPRFVTLCEGDAKLALLGAGLQFTWVGAPSIYYGEEIGMEGGRDPDNRRGMVWAAANDENIFLQEYRALAVLRRLSPALQSGDPSLIEANDADRTLVFRRVHKNQQVFVVVNRSNVERNVAFGAPGAKGTQIDLLSNRVVSIEEQSLSIKMPPLSLAVLADDTAESRQVRSHVHRARAGEVSLP